jgi:AcrR family transcriptional regulator
MAARRAHPVRHLHEGGSALALRRHLIAVTRRLLIAQGLDGLTIRSIASDADVSDGVIYNYFADKDDLLMAALVEEVGERVTDFLDDFPEPGRQDLTAGVTHLVRVCRTFHQSVLPLAGGLLARPDLMRRMLHETHADEAGPHRLWAAVRDFVIREQALGTVDPAVPPVIVAEMLFGVHHFHAVHDIILERTVTATVSDSDQLVTVLVKALRVE